MNDLLVIHGWATDSHVWDETVRELEGEGGEGGEVINISLPGHGGSLRWDEPTLRPALREVQKAASGLKGPVVGLGWSLGGEVLMEHASLNPGFYRALVLASSTPCFVSREGAVMAQGFPHGLSRALVKRMIKDMGEDPAQTVKKFYSLNFTEAEIKTDAARRFIERYKYPGPVDCEAREGRPPGCYPAFNYSEITAALEAIYTTDMRGLLKGLNLPVLIIHGTSDEVCPVGAGEFLKSNIRGSDLILLKDAGHAPFITQRERFNRAVKDFIGRI